MRRGKTRTLVMSDAADHEQRSREIADTTRRLLVAVNTGGIGAAFAVAGSLAAQKVAPGWAVRPTGFFVAGLVVTSISLFLAKHREVKRRNAAVEQTTPPDFTALYWRSFTWDAIGLGLFVAGCIAGLWKLACLQIPT
jgi:hypothetical protein